MTEYHAKLETDSHLDSVVAWSLSPAAQRQLVETIVGTPVRVNFQGEIIGKVVAASIDDVGAHVVLYVPEVHKDKIPRDYLVGPAFVSPLEEHAGGQIQNCRAIEACFVSKEDGDGT